MIRCGFCGREIDDEMLDKVETPLTAIMYVSGVKIQVHTKVEGVDHLCVECLRRVVNDGLDDMFD